MNPDVKAAVLRHVSTGLAGIAIGGTGIGLILGYLTQEQVEKIIDAARQIGEGVGALIVATFTIIQAYNAFKAGHSATQSEQVRKVEETVPGVIVTPVDKDGAKLVLQATGKAKPIEIPTVVVNQ